MRYVSGFAMALAFAGCGRSYTALFAPDASAESDAIQENGSDGSAAVDSGFYAILDAGPTDTTETQCLSEEPCNLDFAGTPCCGDGQCLGHGAYSYCHYVCAPTPWLEAVYEGPLVIREARLLQLYRECEGAGRAFYWDDLVEIRGENFTSEMILTFSDGERSVDAEILSVSGNMAVIRVPAVGCGEVSLYAVTSKTVSVQSEYALPVYCP